MRAFQTASRIVAFGTLLACAFPTLADPPSPRVLFVVDTSGSMNSSLVDESPLGGDGTTHYPGDDEIGGIPHTDCAGYSNPVEPGLNCSRMLQIRQALMDALSAAPDGTGLMRFTQYEAASVIELLALDNGYYGSLDNLTTLSNYDGVGCGSYNFADQSFWSSTRGSAEKHVHGGDLLVEIPFSDALDTRGHVAHWTDNRERWWLGSDPWNLDYTTWSESATLDDGGYPLTSFTNKELRSASNSSVAISTLHEAWTYMNWLRGQDPLGEERRYLVIAVLDGIDNCVHDADELDVYWNLKAPPAQCFERFGIVDCPAIELYLTTIPHSSALFQEMVNFAWSGTSAGSPLSQGRYYSSPLATELTDWIRPVLLDAYEAAIFPDGFGLGNTSRWSLTHP